MYVQSGFRYTPNLAKHLVAHYVVGNTHLVCASVAILDSLDFAEILLDV